MVSTEAVPATMSISEDVNNGSTVYSTSASISHAPSNRFGPVARIRSICLPLLLRRYLEAAILGGIFGEDFILGSYDRKSSPPWMV
jgi:hypothetical protein